MSDFRVNVQIFEEIDGLVSTQRLRQIAQYALDSESVAPEGSVSVLIAGDGVVRELNMVHRGLDEVTDVLAFSFHHQGEFQGGGEPASERDPEAAFPTPPGEEANLGEVIISYPQAQKQAAQAGHSVDREIAHLLVHGLLHLLGYDHAEPGEESLMRAKEDRYLAQAFHGPNRA